MSINVIYRRVTGKNHLCRFFESHLSLNWLCILRRSSSSSSRPSAESQQHFPFQQQQGAASGSAVVVWDGGSTSDLLFLPLTRSPHVCYQRVVWQDSSGSMLWAEKWWNELILNKASYPFTVICSTVVNRASVLSPRSWNNVTKSPLSL